MAINYYEQKLDTAECYIDHNLTALVTAIVFHVGCHIIFAILTVWWPVWWNDVHLLLAMITLCLTIFFLFRHLFLIRDYRDIQERLKEILSHYEGNDWSDARHEDVEWAIGRRWNSDWALVGDSLKDKGHIAYVEAGTPPLDNIPAIKAYYYWLRHKDELLIVQGEPMNEMELVW